MPTGKPFTVPASGGTNLTFPIKTPSKVGQIAFKVTATSGDFSDGELRPIPILPGRMHLMQSRFVTLRDPGQRVMRFDDLARNDDPTRINEQMVVTLDAQLFYSVLSALPYLVNYPYECTEQTLNRFVSTGILSSLYRQYPAIERMAKEFSSRQTQFEQWDASDPNRKMALEETPWLQMAKGGDTNASDLINVLDSRIAKAQREGALAKLRQSQTSSGGFPWFPGGPPSPYMTLYILYGFSKALEFGVDVPREMVRPAWDYMHRHYLDEIVRDMMAHDCRLGVRHFHQLRSIQLSRQFLVRKHLHAGRAQDDARLQLQALERAQPVSERLSGAHAEADGPAEGCHARVGERHGFRQDGRGPGHVLGAGRPRLALVQRHHRNACLRHPHRHGTDSRRTRNSTAWCSGFS